MERGSASQRPTGGSAVDASARAERVSSAIPGPTRYSLIVRCVSGDERAWDDFFRIYSQVTFRFARHAGLSEFNADEVVANVMRNFFRYLRHYDREKGLFRYYLKTVVNREIAAARSGLPQDASLPDSEVLGEARPGERPDDQWAALERQERLRLCLERLRASPEVRQRDMAIFERYVLHDESPETLAREFGISRSRVFVIKHELIKLLCRIREELDLELGEV